MLSGSCLRKVKVCLEWCRGESHYHQAQQKRNEVGWCRGFSPSQCQALLFCPASLPIQFPLPPVPDQGNQVLQGETVGRKPAPFSHTESGNCRPWGLGEGGENWPGDKVSRWLLRPGLSEATPQWRGGLGRCMEPQTPEAE